MFKLFNLFVDNFNFRNYNVVNPNIKQVGFSLDNGIESANKGRKRGRKMSKQKKRIHDTTNDLFMNVMQEARKAGVLKPLDEIKDYELPNENEFYNSDALCLTDYSFNVLFIVNAGSSEGIYIDAYIDGSFMDGQTKPTRRHVGTIKTLREDLEAYKIMGEAAGALTYFACLYVNSHLDRYTPEGEEVEVCE